MQKRRLNFLRKKQKQHVETEQTKLVWLVARQANDKRYFLSGFNKRDKNFMWSSNQSKAMIFHTEKGITHFAEVYLKKRDDIEVIRSPATENENSDWIIIT